MSRNHWVLLVLCAAAAAPLWPQTSTSSVRGTVRDQTGAVIPNAAASLANEATNITSRTTANQVGFYVFPGVLPGQYRLSIEAPGMQKFEGTLTVQVRQDAVVDAVLRVGQTATEVSVQDVTPILTVDNPTLGHVLERQRIEQLPINGRSISSLMQTVPGMESWRAYGLRDGSHEFVLDGAPLGNRLTMMSPIVNRPPGLDTLQEFKVEVNNSSAKFTRPTTAVMSTRSGTNQLHGTAFETHRNNAFGKARTRTDYYKKPPHLVRNEFGANAGGPVYIPRLYSGKDRTFWFFAYEATRNIMPSTGGYTVPTEAMRNGDFRGLVDSQGRQSRIYDPMTTNPVTWERQQISYRGQLNVIDPARLNPLAKFLYQITPMPTHPEVNPLLDNNWWGPVPNERRNWTITSRIDHRFSERDQFYARYTQGDYYSLWSLDGAGIPAPPVAGGMANNEIGTAPNRNLALSWVHSFSPTLFNEMLASVSRERWRTATGGTVKYADQLGLPNPLDAVGWPYLSSTGLSRLTYGSQNAMGTNFTYYVLDDNATKIQGKHELQFGLHFRLDQLNILPDQQQNQGQHEWGSGATSLYDLSTSRTNPLATPFTGHNLANMYLGVMNYSVQFVRGWFYTRAREYALYFQDNYKVTPRLTLNLGLRWERWPALREQNDIMTSFDRDRRAVVLGADMDTFYRLGATLPSIVNRYVGWGAKFVTYKEAGLPQTLMHSNSKNFGPRLGFAWRLGNGPRSLVLRGGYRMSYFAIPVRFWSATMRGNAPLTARFYNSLTNSAQAPDRIANYGMRSAPTMFAGVNSRDAVQLDNPISLYRGAASSNYFAPGQPDPRVHDWNFTLEREVRANTVARVAYIGNHGSRMEQIYRFNDNPPDYIWFVTTGLRIPSGEYSDVARRPWDQQVYGGLSEWRKTGWSNYGGVQVELERRYNKGYGYQVFYVVGNTLAAGGQNWSGTSVISDLNQFLPGRVPAGMDERNRFLNYQRDTSIPKHRVRWNFIVDLPFGKGKLLGGWQIAGMGSLRSTYFSLPTGIYPTGNRIEQYGYKYPIQDCRSGTCYPGYLWWNGYIPTNQINSVDANGKPNGVMGVPADYKPAAEPLNPWPKNPNRNDPMFSYYGSNTVWVTLKDGTQQRTTYNDGLHPWRNQYLPSTRQWGLDASLFKSVPITERVRLRFNADFFNVLNHPGNPSGVGSDGILSVRSSGSGARELQLTLRLSW
ncbi:MAG: TonB-dependent receptor [Acidobacteriota bacterium]